MEQLYDFIDFSGKSANIDRWDDPAYSPFDGFPYWGGMPQSFFGAMTSSVPVDFEHWGISGAAGTTGMEHWQSCLSLMIHV